jgi:hypothetical protein
VQGGDPGAGAGDQPADDPEQRDPRGQRSAEGDVGHDRAGQPAGQPPRRARRPRQVRRLLGGDVAGTMRSSAVVNSNQTSTASTAPSTATRSRPRRLASSREATVSSALDQATDTASNNSAATAAMAAAATEPVSRQVPSVAPLAATRVPTGPTPTPPVTSNPPTSRRGETGSSAKRRGSRVSSALKVIAGRSSQPVKIAA